YHKWFDGTWHPSITGYESMGGAITKPPKAVAWGPNRLDVFVVGTDSGLYHKAWNGSAWLPSLTGYETLGGTITEISRIKEAAAGRLVASMTTRARIGSLCWALLVCFCLLVFWNCSASSRSGVHMKDLPTEIFRKWKHSREEDQGDTLVYRTEGYNFPPA